LHKAKDKEIDFLQMNLYKINQDKALIKERVNGLFNALLELMAERRRILGLLEDSAELMGMQYLTSRAEANKSRLEAHEMMEQSMKVWS
jgi:hypothetical protein